MYICLVPDEHNQHLYFFVVNDDYIPTMEEMMSMVSMLMRWTSSLIKKSYLTPVTKIMNQQMEILGQGQRILLQLKGNRYMKHCWRKATEEN